MDKNRAVTMYSSPPEDKEPEGSKAEKTNRAAFRNRESAPGEGGGLPNVGYTGMCHRPGSIFHFQKSRTGPKF